VKKKEPPHNPARKKKAGIAEKLIRWRRHPQSLSAGLGDRGGVWRAGRHRALVALLSDLSNARSLQLQALGIRFSRLSKVVYLLDRQNQIHFYE